MIRIAIAGAGGRMGQSVMELAGRARDVEVVCGLVPRHSPDVGRRVRVGSGDIALTDGLENEADVLIDFSLPEGTMAWLPVCERREIPMVIGVTGLDESQHRRVLEAAHSIPVLFAANFSVGLNAILGVIGGLLRQLGSGVDIEIVETHHRNKVDAPSGTAMAILEAIQSERGPDEGAVIFGREGKVGPRPANEIAVHAVRLGDVVGRHEIHLSGSGETITIKHEAHSRAAFAAGALRAAQWIVGKGAGFYTMRDVLAPATAEPGRKETDPGF